MQVSCKKSSVSEIILQDLGQSGVITASLLQDFTLIRLVYAISSPICHRNGDCKARATPGHSRTGNHLHTWTKGGVGMVIARQVPHLDVHALAIVLQDQHLSSVFFAYSPPEFVSIFINYLIFLIINWSIVYYLKYMPNIDTEMM
jgi:hypothetical protein